MPGRKRGGWRGRGRGRGRGNSSAVASSPAEESRTPTPAQDSENEDNAEEQDEVATPIGDEDACADEDDQDNNDDEEGEDGEEGDEEEEEEDDGVSTLAKRLNTRLRKPATPSRTPSEQPAPKRRGGFRGGNAWRGRNWKPKGPLGNVQQHPIDLEGNPATIVNDEVLLPDDEEGEKKVDADGRLENGREYRVRTFTIQGKGNRLYMLSTEPARCIGFRDSYLFFQKHRQLAKIVLGEDEKHNLISRGIIPHSYKGRNIGVVTARSVFREFGARIIIGGRKITDDYNVTAAREAGDIEGEIAVPEDRVPAKGEEYDRKRYVAWHGASAVYHSNAPAIGGVLQPIQSSVIHGGPPVKRRKIHVTGSNWMLEHARAASNFNSLLTSLRSANKSGQYDIYTNTMHYPSIYLHSHARWEPIPLPDTSSSSPIPTCISQANSSSTSTSRSPFPPSPPTPTPYPILTPYLTRNATTIDTIFATPSTSTYGLPGPSGLDGWGLGGGGKSLCDVGEDILACLDEDCRREFEKARAEEIAWKGSWGFEGNDGGAGGAATGGIIGDGARRSVIRR